MELEKVKTKASSIFVQIIATFAIAYLTCLTGFIYAWPSYTVANFVSNETVLSHPMSSLEVSLLGSLTNVGGLVVTPFCGYLINNLGRKYSSMLFGVPFVLAWGIIAITNNVSLVLAAVTFSGVGAAGQAVCSVYISEISQDSIRGGLTSTTVFGFFFGLLFSYILGGYLSYQQVLYTHLVLSVIYILMLIMLKESPVFLIQKGREEEAAQAIAFYRQVDVTSKLVEIEIKKIKLQLDPRIDEILQQGENDEETWNRLITTKVPDEPVKSQSELKFLWKSESSKRALLAVLIIMALTVLMGSIVLQVYAEPLFKEAVPSMPSNLCAIFLAVDFVLASAVCAVVVDKLGRKNLLTSTSALSGVCTALLGSQLQYHWAPHWFTAFLIYLYCFIYTCGAAVVPFILTAEVFLPEVRGLGNSVSMAMMWIMNFVTMVIFGVLVEYLGLAQCFYFFTIVCFIGAVYSQMYLPETKGLSADAIQLLFLKKHKSKKNNHVQMLN